MFYRICNLLTLNIELVFVFDGPDVPAKRGRGPTRKVDHKDRELVKDLLRNLGIPFFEALGEAEAECCQLQKLGIVDAVWSQDSDCLMFGCTLRIRDHRVPLKDGYDNRNKGHTEKAAKIVRIIQAETLKEKFRLKREGCVLFAMLAGGDYNFFGLPGCGAATALKAAQSGLGISLCGAKDQVSCKQWRDRVLVPFFKREKIQIAVPESFPSFKILQLYNNPKVRDEADLRAMDILNPNYRRQIREDELLFVTSHRFNTWGNGYMNWIVPTMLTRFLADRDPSLPPEVVHGIELVAKRGPQQTDGSLERTIRFSPFGLTELIQPFFEQRKEYWSGSNTSFEPDYMVQREIPTYLLQKVLPSALFERPASKVAPQGTKRKRQQPESEPKKLQRIQEVTNKETPKTCPSKGPIDQTLSSPCPSFRNPASRSHLLGDNHSFGQQNADSELRTPRIRRYYAPNTPGTDMGSPSHRVTGDTEGNAQDADHLPPENPESADYQEQEERELQLALRMSMEEHERSLHLEGNSSSSASRKGKGKAVIDLTDL